MNARFDSTYSVILRSVISADDFAGSMKRINESLELTKIDKKLILTYRIIALVFIVGSIIATIVMGLLIGVFAFFL